MPAEMGHAGSKAKLHSSLILANNKNAVAQSTLFNKPAGCPFADLSIAISPSDSERGCPFSFHSHKRFDEANMTVKDEVPLAVSMGIHRVSKGSEALLADIGGGDRIREFCTRFYARMHEDSHLKQFLFVNDGPVHHGKRLADWIVEKMGGEGRPWTESGRYGMRQPAHYAAWNSARRHPSVRGDRFNLQDTRAWMRLHFWAVRETGLDKHVKFWSWYQNFIKHFISVYERKAPPYTAESAEWSADERNLKDYMANNNTMSDLQDLCKR